METKTQNIEADEGKKVKISDIKINKDLMPREKLDGDLVKTYSENIVALPPIIINQDKILIDGWHRLEAHKLKELTEIECIVKQTKDKTELMEEAVKANATHGKQLSIREKQKWAIKLFENSNGTPDYKKHLASILGVHQSTLYKWIENIAKSKEEIFKDDIIQFYLHAELTQEQVAQEYGISQKYVSTLIKEIYQILKGGMGIDPNEDQLKYSNILEFIPFESNIWEIVTTNDFDEGDEDDDICDYETVLNTNILHRYSKPFDTVYVPNETQMIDTCTKWLRRYFTGLEMVAKPNIAILEYVQDIENDLTRIRAMMKEGIIIIKCHNIKDDSTVFALMNKQGSSLLNRIIIPKAETSFDDGYESLLVFQV